MKLQSFIMLFVALLTSGQISGVSCAPAIQHSGSSHILNGGKLILVKAPRALRVVNQKCRTRSLKPFIIPGTKRLASTAQAKMFNAKAKVKAYLHLMVEHYEKAAIAKMFNTKAKAMSSIPVKKFPGHCAFCMPVNSKAYTMVIVPVNPHIDLMGVTIGKGITSPLPIVNPHFNLMGAIVHRQKWRNKK